MDNAINTVVTEKALADLEKLAKLVMDADEALIKASQSASSFSKTMSTPPKTSDALNKQLEETQKILKELQNDYKKQETALANLQKKFESLSAAKKQTSAADRQTIIDNREIRKELDGQAIANSNLTSYIQKLSVERAKASRIVADYNAQVAMGTALTEEQSAELAQATASFQKYDNAIKAGKKSIGDAREYVGQYERANLGLVNSVNQIVREVPSATFGIQTFFLAISNNVPIMVDEIKTAVQANKQLAKSGEATVPVWKQVAGALFSFNSILNIGLLVLALYGKEIGKFFTEITKGTQSLNDGTKALLDFQNAQTKGVENTKNELQIYREYVKIAGDKSLGYQKQKIAIDYLKSSYPGLLKSLSDEQIMKLKGSEIDKKIESALGYAERYKANLQEIESINKKIETYKAEINARVQYSTRLKELEKERYDASRSGREILDTVEKINLLKQEEKLRKESVENEIISGASTAQLQESLISLQDIYSSSLKQSQVLKEKSIILEEKDTNSKDDNTRAIKLNTKAREDYLASEYELWRLRKQNESDSNKEIMNDEKMGFELRELASKQFYDNEAELAQRAQIEQIRVLDLATAEKQDINDREYINYKASLEKQLKEDTLTTSQRKLLQKELSVADKQYGDDKVGIEKDAENQRLIINENYIQKYLDINKEMVGKLKAMYNELELAKKDFQISEEDLKASKEINALLQDITPEMSIEEIEGSLNQISKINERTNLDINQKEKELHLERLNRLKEQVEGEIVLQLTRQGKSDDEIQMALRNNTYLINLGKQILDAEKDVQEAKNAIHNQDIKNILDEKKVWKEVNDSIYESRLQLFEKLADLANMGFENVISYYDREIERSNDYYDSLLENAENGSEQEQMLQEEKERKAEQLRKRRVDAERKQAIFNKVLSVGQVVIETSKAIAAINATAAKYDFLVPGSGQAYRASQIPLALASAAVQTGIIMATPLPQYKDGRGKGKDEFAVVGDGGRNEVIQRGNGRIEVTPSVPTITHLGKDDIVHKSLDDFERSRLAIQNASIMASFGKQSNQLQMFDYYLGRELHGISNKIEKGIEKGFKKAKIYNNVNMPKIDIGHLHYKNSGLT